MKKTPVTQCPCGSGEPYERCCGRFLVAGSIPETAEALMRSRYSAYVLGNETWLRSTWDDKTRPEGILSDPAIRWLGLKIVKAVDIDATHATVEFIARGRQGAAGAFRMHEVSRFEKRDGRWIYVDGDVKDETVGR